MERRLIGLDSQTGVRPVKIDETWCRCFAKFLFMVEVLEAKEACGTELSAVVLRPEPKGVSM